MKETIDKIRRVFTVSTKPNSEELSQSVKITGIGIIIIGAVGFLIFLGSVFLGGLI